MLSDSLENSPKILNLSAQEFADKLQSIYGKNQQASATLMADMDDFIDMEAAAREVEQGSDLLDGSDDAPVIKLLNAILLEALNDKASDVHIEPYENEARVRFRLDGVLRSVLSPSVHIAPFLISRIKVMARLDIAEKRLPQDGRMSVKLGSRSIDLRVSTMPSSYGERVVMRLLDKQATHLDLNDLGMKESIRHKMADLISRPHGIVLVTGPTGSGKTTTLYAALEQIDQQQLNIMTVEDPVEYDLQGISQTQINTRAGMSFAKGLRALLRQDPDVILIGEIRDQETAEIATQASLTGHLVFATLHANSAVGTVTRLQDLGVDNLLLASTIRGILAQRLVRKLCDAYKLQHDGVIYQAHGCEQCNQTGYQGRIGLFELVIVDDQVQQLMHSNAGEVELENYIRTQTPSILQSGYDLVTNGQTTMDEILRVTAS
ncbi:UNVERIFIED_CONTAM: hypothetical protein GTU68_007787 [Idotea baltica]|nr:hypothetical protein [Idotea baltica]